MTLIHDRGSDWPGFGYTAEEKDALRAIARRVAPFEFWMWMFFTVVLTLLIFTATTLAGFKLLALGVGGEQNSANLPASIFFMELTLQMTVALAIGLPTAMLPAAALTGRCCGVVDADLPDLVTSAHYYHKLWFQIARIAVLSSLAVLALLLYAPKDGRFALATQLVLPFLGPAVSTLTAAYYFCQRPPRP